ncbi:hypothetical protein [Agromyces humi]|uniref:hypothetical protein n=1 Tax=Agromyces humi TaxID=1766800 RepID=UPI0013577F71|nr:hypothetical protein [Agromyces humi]
MPAPSTPLAVANDARARANELRAEALINLAEGVFTQQDLFEFAATASGKPLLRIPLRQVLLSTPGVGEARAGKVLERLRDLLNVRTQPRDMTIAWLLDSRAGGRRFLAWLDTVSPIRTEPWPGFPWAPAPTGGAR